MKRISLIALSLVTLVSIVGCSDKPQVMESASKTDGAAFNGTGSAFMASGWKPGDKVSWESQLRARLQGGQNDYSKAN
jgi:hypothetical protein